MKRLLPVIAAGIIILFCGCDGNKAEKDHPADKELLLYCGAGIRPPVAELAEIFSRRNNVKIAIDYAGSEVLLSKIKFIRSGDLYMPGDKDYIDQAAEKNIILSRRTVCYWVPTILVQKGNPKNIRGLKDLLKPQIKLGLGDANACAIGRTSKKILAKNNISDEDIADNLIYQSLTVTELGMQIQAKALDAVIVWDATAQYFADHGELVAIEPENNIISTVDIGILKFTENAELAKKFVEFIVSKQGKEIFKKYHYTVDG